MFDDILDKKKNEPEQPTHEEVMKAMEYNIKEKQKMIEKLTKKITELEKQLENKEQQTCTGVV